MRVYENQEWILCTDRMPEDGQSVLYYFECTGTHRGHYRGGNTFAGKDGWLTDDVTHWFPIPDGDPKL